MIILIAANNITLRKNYFSWIRPFWIFCRTTLSPFYPKFSKLAKINSFEIVFTWVFILLTSLLTLNAQEKIKSTLVITTLLVQIVASTIFRETYCCEINLFSSFFIYSAKSENFCPIAYVPKGQRTKRIPIYVPNIK